MKPWLLTLTFGTFFLFFGCAKSMPHEAALHGDMNQLRSYVEHGGNLEEPGDKNWVSGIYFYGGKRPLHMAVEGNRPEAVRYLIGQGADKESRTSAGETPLLISAKTGNMVMFDLLLSLGAQRFATDAKGNTALLVALEGLASDPVAAVEVSRALITRGADVNAANRWKETPLHRAAKYNLEAVARLLVEKGADVNAHNRHGETPLFLSLKPAYGTQNSPTKSETFEFLVTFKQDFHIQNDKGRTLLHRTCSPDYVRTLLAKGVPLDLQDSEGDTPPFFALSHCPAETVALYLEKGFDLSATTAKGQTVVQTALSSFYRDEVVPFVIKKGASVTQQDAEGRSAIHRAASHSPQMLDLIIANGGDINARTKTEATPLHVAASVKVSTILRTFTPKNERDLNTRAYAHLLGKQGIDLNPKDIKGCTPLHRAVNSGSLDKIRLLLERGADVNARENRGHTPMDMAVLKQDARMIDLFKTFGGTATVNPEKRYSVICAYP